MSLGHDPGRTGTGVHTATDVQQSAFRLLERACFNVREDGGAGAEAPRDTIVTNPCARSKGLESPDLV